MTASRQTGVALGIVLWFLAGMSLLVSGIVSIARTDTHMAQLHLARATAVSAGDGAILLMLAEMTNKDPRGAPAARPLSAIYTVGVHEVSVGLAPTSGLINLRKVDVPTFATLLEKRARVSADEAKTVAENMIKWRDNRDEPSSLDIIVGELASPEDLLQVPGFKRAHWDAIRDVVVTHGGDSGKSLDLESAGDSNNTDLNNDKYQDQPSSEAFGRRAGAPVGLDNAYRIDAVIRYGGRTWLRRKWVAMGAGRSAGLPWSFTRIEAPRVLLSEAVSR